MGQTIKLKKGYDIKIKGVPQDTIVNPSFKSNTFAIKPTDFIGNAPIPKVLVEAGQEVKAGDPLFYDKGNPDILYVAPVSGEVAEVKRGPKRAIHEVIILADKDIKFKEFEKVNPQALSKEQAIEYLCKTGCWPFLRQRPYNVIADPTEAPKAIFVSGFDSSPLAPDYNYVVKGLGDYLQAGMDLLASLTSGYVHLGLDSNTNPAGELKAINRAKITHFDGKHPSGNVGTQIHHVDPIVKGERVWTVKLQDVIAIGRVALDGRYNTERLIAIGGPAVKNPGYVKTYLGANIGSLAKDNLTNDHVRFISGNCLTGEGLAGESHLGFFHDQLTVLEEGDKYEFFGWLFPNYARPSLSRTFTSFLTPNKKYDVNTNTHGEERAFVVTGQYEKVVPMDVYPLQLIKSIMYGDFNQMEGLGIYELVEEDVALCEFICPSKVRFQEILRDGLEMMRDQG